MISRSRSPSTEEPTKDIIIQNNVKASKKIEATVHNVQQG